MKRNLRYMTALGAVVVWGTTCSNSVMPPSANSPVMPPSATDPTPPPVASPARTINGQVREVNGGPLSGVTIRSWARGQNGSTDVGSTMEDGTFHIEHFDRDGLWFSKSGYEYISWTVPQNASANANLSANIRMQPALRVDVGAPLANVITADDLSYSAEGGGGDVELFWIGNYVCRPCKLVMTTPVQKGVTLRLSWSGGTPLSVWAGDYYSGPVVIATGERGTSALLLQVPPGASFNTILIGLDPRGNAGFEGEPIAFRLVVETP